MYPNIDISYSNNAQYRQCIRIIFNMDVNVYQTKINTLETDVNDTFDDETRDELSYDNDSASKILDYVFSITKTNELFNKLYISAAANMISTDPQIGIAVLFSYDYFELFHNCVRLFTQTPDKFNTECNEYLSLLNYLT